MLSNEFYGPLNKDQQRFIKNVDTAAALLAKMINDTLNLSRLNSGKEQMAQNNFAVKELFDELEDIIVLPT